MWGNDTGQSDSPGQRGRPSERDYKHQVFGSSQESQLYKARQNGQCTAFMILTRCMGLSGYEAFRTRILAVSRHDISFLSNRSGSF